MAAMFEDPQHLTAFIPPVNSKLMMIDFTPAARSSDARDLTKILKAFPIGAGSDQIGYVEAKFMGQLVVFPILCFAHDHSVDFKRVVNALERTLKRRQMVLVELILLGRNDRAYGEYMAEQILTNVAVLESNLPAAMLNQAYLAMSAEWKRYAREAEELPERGPFSAEYLNMLEQRLRDTSYESSVVQYAYQAQSKLQNAVRDEFRFVKMDYNDLMNRYAVPAEDPAADLVRAAFKKLEDVAMEHPYSGHPTGALIAHLLHEMVSFAPIAKVKMRERYKARVAALSRWQRLLHHLHIRRIDVR